MANLKYRPQHLVLLLALVRRVLGVLHLVRELEERVFDVVEAVRWGLAGARRADGGHFSLGSRFGIWTGFWGINGLGCR